MAKAYSEIPKADPPRDQWFFSEASRALSRSKDITHGDLWQLDKENTVDVIYKDFEREWTKECAAHKDKCATDPYLPPFAPV